MSKNKEEQMIINEKRRFIKSTEVKQGQVLTFKNEGEWIESTKYTYTDGRPKKQLVFKVDVDGQEYDFTVNATNMKAVIELYGRDTAKWVGQRLMVNLVKALVSGELKDCIVLSAFKGAAPAGKTQAKPEEISWNE